MVSNLPKEKPGINSSLFISDFFIKNHYNVESILLSDLYSKYEQNYSNNDVYEEYEKFKKMQSDKIDKKID